MPLPHKSDYQPPVQSVPGGRALIITTSQATLDKVDADTGEVVQVGKATGVYAAEMTEPYYVFSDAGMTVDVASIKGGEIPIDPQSLLPLLRTEHDSRYLADEEFQAKVQGSLAIAEVDIDAYDLVFMSGGWGAAYDFAQSPELGDRITQAYASGKVLASVCHGALGFIGATKPDGTPLVRDVKMTGVTNKQLKQLGIGRTPKHPETELRQSGADYQCTHKLIDVFATRVEVDERHRIVTGQNQKAGVETAARAVALLAPSKPVDE